MAYPLVCMVTSCKGGVGKSTLCANLGRALTLMGKSVALVDCDFGLRTLDLICGVSDEVVYDCFDVIAGEADPEKAVVEIEMKRDVHKSNESGSDAESARLWLLAAPNFPKPLKHSVSDSESETDSLKSHPEPSDRRLPDSSDMKLLCDSINESLRPDVILLDMPGDSLRDPQSPVRAAVGVSDAAIVCTTEHPAAIRAAEKTASMLREMGLMEVRLAVTMYPLEKNRGKHKGTSKKTSETARELSELIDLTSTRLCGVLPYDQRFREAAIAGELIDSKRFCEGFARKKHVNSALACLNLAHRLYGQSGIPFSGYLPLFYGFSSRGRYI